MGGGRWGEWGAARATPQSQHRRRFRQASAQGFVAPEDVGPRAGARRIGVVRSASRAVPQTSLGFGEKARTRIGKGSRKEKSIFGREGGREASSSLRVELFRSHRLLTKDEEVLLGHKIQELMRVVGVREELQKELEEAQAGGGARAEGGDAGRGRPAGRPAKPPAEVSDEAVAAAAGLSVQELAEAVRVGERSKQCLVDANMRLVASVAKKYNAQGLELTDLVQEGTKGLERGAEKFDPSRGYRFSTYATWWIKQAVSRAVQEKGKDVRVPSYIHELVAKARAKEQELLRSDEFPERNVIPVETLADHLGVPHLKLARAIKAVERPVRLDKVMQSGDGDGGSMADMISDPDAADMEEVTATQNMMQDLEKVLGDLTARERTIVCARYGIGGNVLTLQQIGEELSITRERVRQIEQKALRKLRHPSRADVIREYADPADATW